MFQTAVRKFYISFFLVLALLAASSHARAQNRPGIIHLIVDATQAPQKILHARLEMPVQPGPLTLYYPQWIPGEHAPDGPIVDLAGLKFSGNGQTIPWKRDLVDMFSFHLGIPADVNTLDIDLDFLLSAPASGFSAGASATSQLDVLSWNQVLLYPKGWTIDQLTYEASLRLPEGWKFGTALPIKSQSASMIDFDPVSLSMLVDSPVLSGHYFRVIQLTPGQKPSHEIDIAADSQAALAMPPEMEAHYKQLVAEAYAMWGSRHYRDYHFLLTLSNNVAHFGLEHHESSDDRVAEKSLIDDAERLDIAALLPHEYTHSWNGKYRRPADLATSTYEEPMKDDLLWVYEGLTEYTGMVLAARSGLYTPDQYRELYAYIASTFQHDSGDSWRPLQDTADAAQLLYFSNTEWENWRRGTDFYDEGALIWLDADVTMRKMTHGHKSLNDFLRAFEGGPGGEPTLKTYTFDELVAAMNSIVPNDWATFFRSRLDSVDRVPLGGIENGGWKLVYNDQPNVIITNIADTHDELDYMSSIGMLLGTDGVVKDLIHGGMAYNAGIGPGMKIAAIDGFQFSPDVLRDAVEKSSSATIPITLLIMNDGYYKTVTLDYHGGPRYPHIERNNSEPDLFGDIIRPLAGSGALVTQSK